MNQSKVNVNNICGDNKFKYPILRYKTMSITYTLCLLKDACLILIFI